MIAPVFVTNTTALSVALRKRPIWCAVAWSDELGDMPAILTLDHIARARVLAERRTHDVAWIAPNYQLHGAAEASRPDVAIGFEVASDLTVVVGQGARDPRTGEIDEAARAMLDRLGDVVVVAGHDARDVVVLKGDGSPLESIEHIGWQVAPVGTVVPVGSPPNEPQSERSDKGGWPAVPTSSSRPSKPNATPPSMPTPPPTPEIESTTESSKAGRESLSLLVDRLVYAYDGELFTDLYDRAYLGLDFAGRREYYALGSAGAERALRHLVYSAENIPLPSHGAREAMLHLSTVAAAEGAVRTVGVRVARHEGVTYLDLGDADRHVVRIDTERYTIIRDRECPVAFLRPAGYAPLPVPTSGGTVLALGAVANLGDGVTDELVLVVAWLIGVLAGIGPYPLLTVSGEAGSAKTFLTLLLRDTTDPRTARARAASRSEQDLVIAAQTHHVVTIDNASTLSLPMSDALCRMATGGAFATRTLFTNREETELEACRPVILNGIPDLLNQADLADRAITVALRRIPDDLRRPESVVRAKFEALRPALLGALLDAVVAGLRDQDTIALPGLPRMADFARLVAAAESALPWPQGTFLTAYAGVQAATASNLLDGDEFAATLRALVVERGAWTGNFRDLLDDVTRRYASAHGGAPTPRTWPQTAKATSTAVSRAAPALRRLGVHYRQFPRTAAGAQVLLQTIDTTNSEPSRSSAATVYDGEL